MPLRFSSLRRGLLLVAVNHEKGEPHKQSEALGSYKSVGPHVDDIITGDRTWAL